MISQIRNSVFVKVLWRLMVVYLLNISVDAADPYPDYIPEDLSYNDQESIVEFFVEIVLGYENAIGEYDDHDTEDHNKKNNVKIDKVFLFAIDSDSLQLMPEMRKLSLPDFGTLLNKGFYQIDTPPPKC